MEARNLAPLPADVDHSVAAALPISGLTAWQCLFDHGRLKVGQTVMIHGTAGGVGSIAVQLAREAGVRVIATGRASSVTLSGILEIPLFGASLLARRHGGRGAGPEDAVDGSAEGLGLGGEDGFVGG